jgi:hypothetical protein
MLHEFRVFLRHDWRWWLPGVLLVLGVCTFAWCAPASLSFLH